MKFDHILKSSQFDRKSLEYLFDLSDKIRKFNTTKSGLTYLQSFLPHKRAMLFFSQPSTRTFLSFQSACHTLGMHTSEIRDPSTSSEKKGESIEDSLRTFSSYVDLIVMRTPVAGLCERIAQLLDKTPRSVPVINAGSGPDEHPTQALLDIYTLNRCFKATGGIDGKTICMVGDLKRGRTVRSLASLLTNFNDIKIIFCSPEQFKMADDLRATLDNAPNVTYTETTEFLDAIGQADAIYMQRIQDEYDTQDQSTRNLDISKYCLKYDHLDLLKPTCKILHAMPRRQELDPKIDQDPRAEYWSQQRNGMWIRSSLIAMLMGVDQQLNNA
ncbi:MAG TPA: aspartate carbamoyltransferase [Gammaproteobacteria bacterium]|nr:aspartate carbamoyltransferase [Gammaproteobacteria bacterium]